MPTAQKRTLTRPSAPTDAKDVVLGQKYTGIVSGIKGTAVIAAQTGRTGQSAAVTYPRIASIKPQERNPMTATTTYQSLLDAHQVDIPAHLEADAEIPILSGLQRQGDVIVIPIRAGNTAGLVEVPPEGIPVVRGEAGGNTHLLVAAGDGVTWAARTATAANPDLGTLIVPEGSTAYLLHPEHGAQGIGPGSYIFRRQVEAGEQARLVAD